MSMLLERLTQSRAGYHVENLFLYLVLLYTSIFSIKNDILSTFDCLFVPVSNLIYICRGFWIRRLLDLIRKTL